MIGLLDSKNRRPVDHLSVTGLLDNLDHAIVELAKAKAKEAAPLPASKLKLIETVPKPGENSLDPISAAANVYRIMQ